MKKAKIFKLNSTFKSLNLFNEQLYSKLYIRKKIYNSQEIINHKSIKKLKNIIGLDNQNFLIPYITLKKKQILSKDIGKSFISNNLTLLKEKKVSQMKMFNFSTFFSFFKNQILVTLSCLLKSIFNLSKKQNNKFFILILKPKKGGMNCLYNGLIGFFPKAHSNYFNLNFKNNFLALFKNLFLLQIFFKKEFSFLLKIPIKNIIFSIIYNSNIKKISRKKKFINKFKLFKTITPVFLLDSKKK